MLPTLLQLQSFQGSDRLATQVYIFTPCPSVIAREDSALAAMHVCTHARSQLKQPGPAFPPDSPMGARGLNSLMRWDSQKCIARQRGTAGQSGPETEGAGKPVRGAAPVAGIRHRAAVVEMQTKLSEKKSRQKTVMERAKPKWAGTWSEHCQHREEWSCPEPHVLPWGLHGSTWEQLPPSMRERSLHADKFLTTVRSTWVSIIIKLFSSSVFSGLEHACVPSCDCSVSPRTGS